MYMTKPHFKEASAITYQLYLGQTVRNFGEIAKIIGFHELTGDPILRPLWNDGTKWIAGPEFCEPLDGPRHDLQHKDGLIRFGQKGPGPSFEGPF